jgi:hypothetical protein
MARTNLPLHQIVRAGAVEPAAVAGDAVNGHSFNNDGKVFLQLENTGATSRNFTMHLVTTVDGQAVADRVIAVAAGVIKKVGPFPVSQYGKTATCEAAHAELTLTAFHL